MKKILITLAGLGLAAMLFAACSDVAVNPEVDGTVVGASGIGSFNPQYILTISTIDDEYCSEDEVNVTVKLTGNSAKESILSVQKKVDGVWETIESSATCTLSQVFALDADEILGYELRGIARDGDCGPGQDVKSIDTASITLTEAADCDNGGGGECTEPLSIHVSDAGTGVYDDAMITWLVKLTVKACEDFTGVTSQGGINAKQSETLFDASKGDVDLRKATGGSNFVSIWTIGDMEENDTETLDIAVTKPLPKNWLKDCATAKYPMETTVIGSWDVSYLDEFGTKIKADEASKVMGEFPSCL